MRRQEALPKRPARCLVRIDPNRSVDGPRVRLRTSAAMNERTTVGLAELPLHAAAFLACCLVRIEPSFPPPVEAWRHAAKGGVGSSANTAWILCRRVWALNGLTM